MKGFKDGQRVKVVDGDAKAMDGMTGTVVRRRMGDNGAWVCMDADLPGDLAKFPEGDDRHRHALLYPDECEPLDATPAK